jgi:hypothetical protein
VVEEEYQEEEEEEEEEEKVLCFGSIWHFLCVGLWMQWVASIL